MRQKMVYWFLRWAINHYGELWTISYTRMGKYATGIYDNIDDARRRAHQIITNFEEAETFEKAYKLGADEVHIKHLINIPYICMIEIAQDHEVFNAHRPVNVSDMPTF